MTIELATALQNVAAVAGPDPIDEDEGEHATENAALLAEYEEATKDVVTDHSEPPPDPPPDPAPDDTEPPVGDPPRESEIDSLRHRFASGGCSKDELLAAEAAVAA